MPKIVTDEAVFRATVQTVIERGYTGATTKQIAAAANISEVTLFRKYGSKAELVRQAIAMLTDAVDFTTAAEYTGNVTADLLRVVQAYQSVAEENGQFMYVLFTEVPRHPELSGLLGRPLGMMNTVGRLMARYQAEGVLQPEHPLHAVAALLGPLMAMNMMREVRPDMAPPLLDLVAHVEGFVNGRTANS
ncbi:MAG: hypothetical protein Kow0080_01630 [Candidatus Promineifilaceae bacterium]